MMVLEGLKGKPGAERCTEPQLSQALGDQWRDQCLAHAATAVDDPQRTRNAARLAQEHVRLKPLVGELTCELTDEQLA